MFVAALLRMHLPRLMMTSRVSSSPACLQIHRQRNDLQLHDQRSQEHAVTLDVHSLARFPAQLLEQRWIEHVAVEPQIKVHDVVEHAAGSIDLVHEPVLVDHRGDAGICPPFVGAGRAIANHLEMIGTGVEGEAERDRAGRAGRALEFPAARAHLLGDLVEDRNLADVVEADRGVVVAERPARHEAVEKHAGLIVKPGGDVEIGQRRAEQAVDIRSPMQHRVGEDARRAVLEGDHERHNAVVGKNPAPDHEGGANAVEARLDHIERDRTRHVRRRVQETLEPAHDALRVAFEVPERDREAGDTQKRGDELGVDVRHRHAAVHGGHGERPQLARRRKGIGHRPPDSWQTLRRSEWAKLKAVSAS